MRGLLRHVAAVVAGTFAGVVVLSAVEAVGSRLYPLAPGVDPANMEALKAHVSTLPAGGFILVLAGLMCCNAVGSWLAARLGRTIVDGLIVGALLLLATVMNMLALPHPAWFWAAALTLPPACSYLGARLGSGVGARGRVRSDDQRVTAGGGAQV